MTGWIQNLPQLSIAVTILWKVTILLGAGWIFHLLLLRRNPRWRVLLWRGVIVGALLLPAWEIVGPRLNVKIPPPQTIEVPGHETPYPMERTFWPKISRPPVSAPVAPVPSEPTLWERAKENLGFLLLAFWALVACLLAVRVFVIWKSVRRIIRSSSPAPEPVHRLLARISEDLRCRRWAGVHTTGALSSPFLTGLLRVLIILPRRFLERGFVAELPAVLAHEVAHLRTNDLVWIFVAKCFGTLFWFHPLAWKIPSAHSGACEEVCDAVAAEYVGGTREYSGMLARFALELLADAPAHGGVPMILASRIMKRLHVLKRGINAAALAKRWVIPTVSTGLIIFAGLGSVRLIYAERQTTEPKDSASETEKETTMTATVKREDNKVFIEGFEEKFWGRCAGTLNSVMYTYSLLMNHLGDETATYDELMGVSGAAFRIQILEAKGDLVPGLWGPCPSSPHANCGFECSTEARNAFGLEVAHYEAKAGDTEAERKRRQAIIRSIDQGVPAMYEKEENDLIVGYFPDDESKYLRRCYGAKKEGYVELTDWGWGYAEVLTEWGEPRPERENHLNSLKLAVRLAHSERFNGYLSGFNAYETWITGLENDKGYAKCEKDPMPWGNAWCFENLIDARAAAARYLRSIKGEYKQNTVEHLEKAADFYEQISSTLAAWQKEAPNLWELNSKEKWTKEFRESEATVLKTAMDLERKAVTEIEKALAAEDVDVVALKADTAWVEAHQKPPGEKKTTMKKLEGLKWKPMWTTRIGCLKGCVDYLGVEASDSWFFGASGHAFALNIHEELCPSGPTAWNTGAIDRLAGNIGVSIEGLGAHKSEPYFASTQEEVWKKICAAIDQGYPCFGWELEIPEFYVVRGYTDDSYIFTGPLDEEEATKPWKELGDTGIGVIEMGIVRPGKAASDKKLVRDALEYALEVSRNPEGWTGPLYDMGLAGYDLWIKALEERKAGGYGHSYNAQVWSECRRHAVGFLKEAKTRLNDEQLNPLFDQAIAHYEKVAENLTKVAETYPIEGDDADHQMEDEEKRRTCLEALRTVRTEEEAGLGVLEQIIARLSDEG